MHKQISSTQNPQVKRYLLLSEKSRERKKTGQFVVEGVREIRLALEGGYQPVQVFYCPEILDTLPEYVDADTCEILEVTPAIERARSQWRYFGQERPPFAQAPAPGQRSVWDLPRPPL